MRGSMRLRDLHLHTTSCIGELTRSGTPSTSSSEPMCVGGCLQEGEGWGEQASKARKQQSSARAQRTKRRPL